MQLLRWTKIVPRGAAYHVARVRMRGRHACRVHTHDFAEVFWVENGHGVQVINGQRQPVTRGTLVLIRAADRHGFHADQAAGLVLVNIAFPVDSVRFIRERYFAAEQRWFWTDAALPHTQPVSGAQLGWLGDWAERLAAAPKTRLEIERFLLELLHELAAGTREPPPADLPEWLAVALEQIREPRHFVAGTRGLARVAGRTPEHVAREIKRRLGLTPTDIVNRARLDYAARRLPVTTQKIIEIALECGFHNLSHFHLVFRQRFGITPRQYRLCHQTPVR